MPFHNRACNHSVSQLPRAVGRRPAWEQDESEDAYPEGDIRSHRSGLALILDHRRLSWLTV